MLHLEFCSAVEAKDFQVATGIIKEHPELDINELYGPLLLSQSNKTSTLLNVSVVHEDKEMVKFLLRQPNIDVNRTGDIEWSFIDVNVVRSIETPLYSAVKNGCVEIVQLLLNHPGIDIYKGCTEYYYEYGFPKTDSFTPLDEAFTMRREDLIEMFISHTKMDVNRRDKEGMAPLEMALVYKCRKIAILLINNLNTEITKPRYEVGHNILHLACDERSPDTLKLILARQEHIDTKIKIIHERHWINGKNTALKIARTDEIRKLLEDYEIDPHRVRFALRSELGFNGTTSFFSILFFFSITLFFNFVYSERCCRVAVVAAVHRNRVSGIQKLDKKKEQK
jgi:ankyrin repeat protein